MQKRFVFLFLFALLIGAVTVSGLVNLPGRDANAGSSGNFVEPDAGSWKTGGSASGSALRPAVPDEWTTYHSEAGNFSISAPGIFRDSATTTETPLGPIQVHTFVLEHRDFKYAVEYTDYPVPGIVRANELGALDGSLQRTLDSLRASLRTKRDILLGWAAGIAYRGELGDDKNSEVSRVIYGRVYLCDARLYSLLVIADKEHVMTADPERFLASFQFTPRTLPAPANARPTPGPKSAVRYRCPPVVSADQQSISTSLPLLPAR